MPRPSAAADRGREPQPTPARRRPTPRRPGPAPMILRMRNRHRGPARPSVPPAGPISIPSPPPTMATARTDDVVIHKPEAQAKRIVPPPAAPSRPVNLGLGDLVLIATCLYSGVW